MGDFLIQDPVREPGDSAPCVGDFFSILGDIPGRRSRERPFPLVGDPSLFPGDIPGRRSCERPVPLVGAFSPFFGDIPGIGKRAPHLCPAPPGRVKGGYPKGERALKNGRET